MINSIKKLPWAMGLALWLGFMFVPLGCGSTYEAVYESSPRSSSNGLPEAPEHVVA